MTRLLLLRPFYTIQTQKAQTFLGGVYDYAISKPLRILSLYSPNIYTVQLGKFSEVQMISLILHSIYIVHSGSSFFFTQRRVSVPSFHSMRERFWVFCILACIFVPKIMSFGLLFSYARTFLTVAFIVLFGIGTMALFYDQLGTIHVFTEQF